MIKTELKRTTTEIYNDYVFCFILFIIFFNTKGAIRGRKKKVMQNIAT